MILCNSNDRWKLISWNKLAIQKFADQISINRHSHYPTDVMSSLSCLEGSCPRCQRWKRWRCCCTPPGRWGSSRQTWRPRPWTGCCWACPWWPSWGLSSACWTCTWSWRWQCSRTDDLTGPGGPGGRGNYQRSPQATLNRSLIFARVSHTENSMHQFNNYNYR